LVASDRFVTANLELNTPSRMTLHPAVDAARAMESIIGTASRTGAFFRRHGAIATESGPAEAERCPPMCSRNAVAVVFFPEAVFPRFTIRKVAASTSSMKPS
jgi:hypothetical protein